MTAKRRTARRPPRGPFLVTSPLVQDPPDLPAGHLAAHPDRLRELAHAQLLEQPRHLGQLAVHAPARGQLLEPVSVEVLELVHGAHAVTVDGRSRPQALEPPFGAAQVAFDVGQPASPGRRDGAEEAPEQAEAAGRRRGERRPPPARAARRACAARRAPPAGSSPPGPRIQAVVGGVAGHVIAQALRRRPRPTPARRRGRSARRSRPSRRRRGRRAARRAGPRRARAAPRCRACRPGTGARGRES